MVVHLEGSGNRPLWRPTVVGGAVLLENGKEDAGIRAEAQRRGGRMGWNHEPARPAAAEGNYFVLR